MCRPIGANAGTGDRPPYQLARLLPFPLQELLKELLASLRRLRWRLSCCRGVNSEAKIRRTTSIGRHHYRGGRHQKISGVLDHSYRECLAQQSFPSWTRVEFDLVLSLINYGKFILNSRLRESGGTEAPRPS